MFRRNGSEEDQRLKAEMEARNRALLANGPPRFRGTGPADREERIIPMSAFELPTINQFLKAAQSGDFPGNKKTELPLWPASEMEFFSKKYAEWAPPPYSELPVLGGPFGNMPGQSPPAIFRVMNIMSGLNDIMDDALEFARSGAPASSIGPGLAAKDIERSFKLFKTKVWFGLPPVSTAHWNAKALDHEDNIEEALSILQAVVDVWDYYRTPTIQGQLRNTFNKIFVEMDVFQDASNARHSVQGERVPGWSLGKLWQEYVRWHFANMEKQSRSFLLTHLLTLQTIWKTQLMNALQGGRQINATQTTIKIDHVALMVLNKIQDLYFSVDTLVRGRTDGFMFVYGVDPRFAGSLDGPQAELNALYESIERKRMVDIKNAFDKVIADRGNQRRALGPMPAFTEPVSLLVDREFSHKNLQPEVENPPVFETESWVQDLAKSSVESFGFVVYRLDYEETDDEWETSKRKIERAIESGWEGVVGAEQVKHKAKLHWIDGSENAISEGDLDACRQHFKTLTEEESTFPESLSQKTCLAITPTSLSSLKSTNQKDPSTEAVPGDFSIFLHAVSSTPASPPQNPPASSRPARPNPNATLAGYDATLKILAHLVFTDLYALRDGMGNIAKFEELWSISTKHPWAVYSGPTTAVMRRKWREMEALSGEVLKLANEGKERRQEGA
ncbi:hypothetical protein G7Y89_g15644 [Cudoniella acicularis]|uniref:Uncharacterized protein n=1 Tax=Cudoniella acicularis TaxID=354080 RepID=A0A8H4VKN4_9HELO|nr:hypothetical protein G7Y89_g15644 [Cudoniella acicularis]